MNRYANCFRESTPLSNLNLRPETDTDNRQPTQSNILEEWGRMEKKLLIHSFIGYGSWLSTFDIS